MTFELEEDISKEDFEFLNDFEALEYEDIFQLSLKAILKGDLDLLMLIARFNWIVVSRALSEASIDEIAPQLELDPIKSVILYRSTRWGINESMRKTFRRLVAKAIMRGGRRIVSHVHGKSIGVRKYYEPGDDFDLEETIERLIESASPPGLITYDHIVGIGRMERKAKAIIILDTSGSMSGEKIAHAAISASVAAHLLRGGELCLITFNSDADIRRASSPAEATKLIEDILDVVPIGYTNIKRALELAKKEGEKMKGEYVYLLITDGNYNVGGDPREVAAEMRKLNVIFAPGPIGNSRGRRVCEDLARLGNGRFIQIESYSEIPYVVPELLQVR